MAEYDARRRYFTPRITRKQQRAIDALYFDTLYERIPMPIPAHSAKKFGDVVKPPAQYEFIKPEELTKVSRFTITGARLMNTRYGSQWYFDIAFKNGEAISKRCISLSSNSDRDAIAQAVKENGMLIGCRLDFVATRFANQYAKIVDADSERQASETEVESPADASGGSLPFKDEDIPF